MNLSAYSLEQLVESRRVLSVVDVTSVLLKHLDEDIQDEIEYRATITLPEVAGFIQRSLETLNQYTPNYDANEVELYHAWKAIRMAIEAMRPVSQKPNPQ